MGESRQPELVLPVRSYYRGMAPPDAQLLHHKLMSGNLAGGVLPAGTTNLGSLTVPSGQVLDITGLFFNLEYRLPGGTSARMPSDSAAGRAFFQILVNDRSPWQTLATSTAGGIFMGFDYLATNVLEQWGSAPSHLIVPAKARMDFRLVVGAATWTIPGNSWATATLVGRRLSQALYDRLQELEART